MKNIFITITDINRFYGQAPFKRGKIVKLSKPCGNGDGKYDMRVTLPLIGRVGRVARNSAEAAEGTYGAPKIYRKMGRIAYAQVMFATEHCVIARLLLPDEVRRTPYIGAYQKR